MDQQTSTLLEYVADIQPVIETHAQRTEQDRQLADPIYDAFLEHKLFTMLLPKALGGMELHPVSAYKVWEAVARIDSAAAWNLAQASAGIFMSARLSAEGLDRIYGKLAQPIFSGAGFPPGTATRVEGGFTVSARLPFVSGCHRADWFFFPILTMVGDQPESDPNTGAPVVRLVFLPSADVEIIDTWNTFGMRGTGSADIEINNVFVPEIMTVSSIEVQPAFAGPLYKMAPWPVIQGEAVASLGVATAAIDFLQDLAKRKTPAMSGVMLRDRELVQMNLGRAQALVEAARAYLYQSATSAFESVQGDMLLSMDAKISMQFSACNVAEGCAKAVDLVYEAAGSSGIRVEEKLERLFRDVHVMTQHATKSTSRYITAGRVMLGLAADNPLLAAP